MSLSAFMSNETLLEKSVRFLRGVFTRNQVVPDIPECPPTPAPAESTVFTRFRVDYLSQIGPYLVVQIDFQDLGGDKILVYEGLTKEDFRSFKRIDPDFNAQGVAPLANFEPTAKGLRLAKWMCWNVSRSGVGY